MNEQINLLQGDCLQTMKTIADNSVDAIVSDPPYGISFMAKKWDYDVPSVEVWKEAIRVLKPGGHALIACGTRTQHRMVVNIENAGFEIRDVVSWIYGSGFPKSLNISKAIDKAAGAEREVVGIDPNHVGRKSNKGIVAGQSQYDTGAQAREVNITAPATDAAKQWDGWGTALKPSSEFFTLCRKPLSEKTIAANVLKWGTGGINIDGCRVGTEKTTTVGIKSGGTYNIGLNNPDFKQDNAGRFPANLIHDGSQEVLDLFPETAGGGGCVRKKKDGVDSIMKMGMKPSDKKYGKRNKGSAARFFYCAKASKKDRDEGNHHPTVKPTALMQYLCRLITPAGGTVLDPYMGSGSTGKAAIKEGFSFVGCELDVDYFAIASKRINN